MPGVSSNTEGASVGLGVKRTTCVNNCSFTVFVFTFSTWFSFPFIGAKDAKPAIFIFQFWFATYSFSMVRGNVIFSIIEMIKVD